MLVNRIAALVLCAIAAIHPALAQAPPPVPPVPDANRYQSYNLTSSTATIPVNFPVYGDCSDLILQRNGVPLTLGSAWSCASVSGIALSSKALPITDIQITLTPALSSGFVEVIGSWRPRNLVVASAPGITRREFNQAFGQVISSLRETRTFAVPPAGISTYVLTSQGPGLPPIWATPFTIAPGSITNVHLASGVAVANIGYQPLNPASNLSDVASASASRSNLGLGSAAVLNAGTSANNLVQLNGSAKLPAVDGSLLTSIPGSALTGSYPASALTLNSGALLGRSSASVGPAEEISVSGGLTLSGGVLSSGLKLDRIDTLTSSGTYTKQTGDVLYVVRVVGAGGGGGAGRRSAPGVQAGGGAGGNAGYIVEGVIPAGPLPTSNTFFVGAGGVGGASAANSTNGSPGSNGGYSAIFNMIALGGAAGGGGSNAAGGAAGVAALPVYHSSPFTPGLGWAGGASTGGAGPLGSNNQSGPTGGGGGAGLSSADVEAGGGTAGGADQTNWGSVGVGGVGGTVGSPNGGIGTVPGGRFGSGGGGGASKAAAAAGNGGNGNGPGAGAGGGGGGRDGQSGGAGGTGGNGQIVIYVYK